MRDFVSFDRDSEHLNLKAFVLAAIFFLAIPIKRVRFQVNVTDVTLKVPNIK